MAKYRVREVYKVHVYTYVEAESQEDAQRKLELGDYDDPDFDHPIEEYHESTDWSTLKEVK